MADSEIEQAWQTGRAAWPNVALPLARFAAFATERERDLKLAADLYLAAACVAGDTAALAAFEREVIDSARKAIAAIDASSAFVDEAMQRLRASLLVGPEARIQLYAGRGPLRAWVGVAGARHALMLRRAQKRERVTPIEDDEWTDALATISTNNPELELLKQQYKVAFNAALRDAVRGLEPRLRAVLRMSFVDDVSIDEIGAVYAVHRATAARWIQRACDAVFAATREQLAERLALTPTELDRMTALVRSQLDVSLSQLLPPAMVTSG